MEKPVPVLNYQSIIILPARLLNDLTSIALPLLSALKTFKPQLCPPSTPPISREIAMSEVILYDIPSKEPRQCWSLNPWKSSLPPTSPIPLKHPTYTDQSFPARLVLNLKGIPYKTEWLEYPDIGPTFKSLGIPPAEPPAQDYTSPAIRLGDNYVMDSRKIADALEQAHPSPSLHLDSPILQKVEELVPGCVMPIAPVFLPLVPRFILSPRSAEYFERTRAERFGMPLSQWEREKGGEGAWKASEPKWKELGELLKAEGGPFFMGKTGEAYRESVYLARRDSNQFLNSVVRRLDPRRCTAVLQVVPGRLPVPAGDGRGASFIDALRCGESVA